MRDLNDLWPMGLETSQMLSHALIASGLKVALMALIVVMASPLLRYASAAMRRLTWFAVLLSSLAILPAQVILRSHDVIVRMPRWWPTSAPQRPLTTETQKRSVHHATSDDRALLAEQVARDSGDLPTSSDRSSPLVTSAVVLIWVLGCAMFANREWRAERKVRQIREMATSVTTPEWLDAMREAKASLGLRINVRFLMSEHTEIPFVGGTLRPAIIVPAAAYGWSAQHRRAVILHELAHLTQRDLVFRAVARAACVVHWFNPAVWLVARRELIECERAADDVVVTSGMRPSTYATMLLDAAATMTTPAAPRQVLSFASRSTLPERVWSVLNASENRRTAKRPMAGIVVVVALLVGVTVGSVQEVHSATLPPFVAAASPSMVTSLSANQHPVVRRPFPTPEPSSARPIARIATWGSHEFATAPDVVGALIRALRDANSHVRAAAARSLGRLSDTRIAPALRAAAIDPDAFAREEILDALARQDAQRAHLHEVLK